MTAGGVPRPDPADEAAFEALARRAAGVTGLALGGYKAKCVRRRIAARMRACGARSWADYGEALERLPGEAERLRDALTINVSRFYRNAATWERVRANIVPAICPAPGAPVRAWSAGCASGEEPYTLAVLLADHLDRLGRGPDLARVTVDATDVDPASVARARAACYGAGALAELPPDLLARHFEPAGEGFRVAERVRGRVRVRRADLHRDPPPAPAYELVLCRNVVIYFDRATQERLFRGFADVLAPGGYLVLGKVETLVGPARERLALVDARERIYRKAA